MRAHHATMSTEQPPSLLNNRYELLERLGEGHMGWVYRAHDRVLRRQVAIKFIAPHRIFDRDTQLRFLREAQAIARFNHPNLMHLYDAGQEAHWQYLVLEYVQGETLRGHLVAMGGSLTLRRVLPLLQDLLRGLDYIHQQGIIHRDLKPENLMLTPEHQLKIMDFGLALHHADLRVTGDDMVVGTVFYMAPEAMMGASADPRSDLYAVGTIAYEMLAGVPPFSGNALMAVMGQILNHPPDFQAIPRLLHVWLERMLAKDPNQRYDNAADALMALPMMRPSTQQIEVPVVDEVWEGINHQHDHSTAIERERRDLAARLEMLAAPLQLLLAQASAYEQSFGANPQARLAVGVLGSLAQNALQHLRDLEMELHPTLLESLGLVAALETLTAQFQRRYGVALQLQISGLHENRLPAPLELALYRTIQHYLDTTIRRSNATQVSILLKKQHDGELVLRLQDNRPVHTLDEHVTLARLRPFDAQMEASLERQEQVVLHITLPLLPPVQLTEREMDMLNGIAQGLSNRELALHLNISARTVNFHLDNLYSKLGVASRTEALVAALRRGILSENLFK